MRNFLAYASKSTLLSNESKNRQKQLLNERGEPKLASNEPEGGKPTLAQLSDTCRKITFFVTQKSQFLKTCRTIAQGSVSPRDRVKRVWALRARLAAVFGGSLIRLTEVWIS